MLFRPLRLGPVTVAGRIARSATSEGASDGAGRPTEALKEIYRRLALGGAPWVNTGYAYILPNGRSDAAQNGIHTDDLIGPWRMILEAVRAEAPECKFFLQIVHGGRQIAPACVPDPIAPSAVPVVGANIRPREMTKREIEECLQAFADAARRARQAGFDGIQLHCAHGYLLSQFLSPYTNRRLDEWGGTPERRRRFVLESLSRVREAAGPNLAVAAKLDGEDFHPQGLALAESCEAARAMAERGMDAIEVSGFIMDGDRSQAPSRPGDPGPGEEGYYLAQAVEIQRAVGETPVGVCGGFRSAQAMRRALESDGLSFVALSRPFIAEPDLVRRLRAGQPRASCVSCNRCRRPLACALVAEGTLTLPPPPEDASP